MTEIKPTLKGFDNLVTIADLHDEISNVDILLKTASPKQTNDLLKYRKQLNKELSIHSKLRGSV